MKRISSFARTNRVAVVVAIAVLTLAVSAGVAIAISGSTAHIHRGSNLVNASNQWRFEGFYRSGSSGTDTISNATTTTVFTFPQNVDLSGIGTPNWASSGGGSGNAASYAVSGQTLSIRWANNISLSSGSYELTFYIPGLINPSEPGSGNSYGVAWSIDSTNGATPYHTTGTIYDANSFVANTTTLSSLSIAPADAFAGSTNVTYTVGFTSGSQGRLSYDAITGANTVNVYFSDHMVPSSPTAAWIWDASNGTTVTASATRISDHQVRLTVPSGRTIPGGTAIRVAFNGITNPSAGNYNAEVWTSAEDAATPSHVHFDITTRTTLTAASANQPAGAWVARNGVKSVDGFTLQRTSGSAGISVTGVTIDDTGTAAASTVSGVSVYRRVGSATSWNPATDTLLNSTPGTFSGSSASVTFDSEQSVTGTSVQYWVVYTFASGAADAATASSKVSAVAQSGANTVTNSTVVGKIFTVDALAPVTTLHTLYSPPPPPVSRDITFTLSATDAESGVKAIHYSLSGATEQADTTAVAGAGPSAPITISNDGTTTVTYWAVDDMGNIESHQTTDIVLYKPMRVSWTEVSDGWVNYDVVPDLVATDTGTGGVAWLAVSPDNSLWTTATPPAPQPTFDYEFTVSTEGSTTWFGRGGSAAGYTTLAAPVNPAIVKIDRTDPIAASNITSGTWTKSAEVTFTAYDPIPPGVNAVSGVKAIYYAIDGGSYLEYDPLDPPTVADGQHTVRFWAEDNAGNKSDEQRAGLWVDTLAPVTESNITSGTWTRTTEITFTATDPGANADPPTGSGVFHTYYRLDGGGQQTYDPLSPPTMSDGKHTLQFWSVDNAGNKEATQTTSPWVDTTGPVSTLDCLKPTDTWASTDVTFSISAVDTRSPVATIFWEMTGATTDEGSSTANPTDPVTVSNDGTTTVTYWSKDQLGNEETPHKTYVIKIDKSFPLVEFQGFPTGWVNHSASGTLHAAEGTSGLLWTEYRWGSTVHTDTLTGGPTEHDMSVTVTAEGTTTILGGAKSVAGLSTPADIKVYVDETSPTASYSCPEAGIWESRDVTFTVSGADTLSGVKAVYYRLSGATTSGDTTAVAGPGPSDPVTVSNDGTTTVTYWSADEAGNKSLPQTFQVKIDRSLVVGWSGVPDVWVNWPKVTAQLQGTDTLTGVSLLALSSDESTWTTATPPAPTPTFSFQFSVTAEGNWVRYGRGQAGSGGFMKNADPYEVNIRIDRTAPVSESNITSGTWTHSSEVTFTAYDPALPNAPNGSGIEGIYYAADGSLIPIKYDPHDPPVFSDGKHIVRWWSQDNAGNVEADQEAALWVDARRVLVYETDGTPGSSVSINRIEVDYGDDSLPVTATAPVGWHFTDWTGTGSFETTTSNPLLIKNVTENATMTAHFTRNAYTLHFKTDGTPGSSVSSSTEVVLYGDDSEPVTATAPVGWRFVNWTVEGHPETSTDNPLIIENVSYDGTMTANFGADQPVVTTIHDVPATWVNTNVTFSLTATGGVPPLTPFYKLGGATSSAATTYTVPVLVSNNGTTTLDAWSVDSVDQRDATTRTATIRIDKIDPVTTSNAASAYTGPATVTLYPTDTLSGVADTYYRLSTSGGWTTYSGPIPVDSPGNKTLQFYSTDNAGNEESAVTATFTVNAEQTDVEGAGRYDTAVKASESAFPTDSVRTVVLATGADYPDALSAGPLAGAHQGPVLLTTKDTLPPSVSAEIDRLGATDAVIVGGTGAVGASVFEELVTKLGAGHVTRIAGGNRYGTSALVAEEILRVHPASHGGTVFVATGLNFPDALSGSPDAWVEVRPILLVAGATVPQETLDAIDDVGATRAVVLGGTGVVPPSAATIVQNRLSAPKTLVRLGGGTRYGTAQLVAEWSAAGEGLAWRNIGIATGTDFADALAGGPAMGMVGGPMLLTAQNSLPTETQEALTDNKATIIDVRFFGGTGAISAAVRNQVMNLLK